MQESSFTLSTHSSKFSQQHIGLSLRQTSNFSSREYIIFSIIGLKEVQYNPRKYSSPKSEHHHCSLQTQESKKKWSTRGSVGIGVGLEFNQRWQGTVCILGLSPTNLCFLDFSYFSYTCGKITLSGFSSHEAHMSEPTQDCVRKTENIQ